MALPIAAIANGVKTAIDLAKTDNSTGSETKFADVKPYEVESTDIKRTEGDLGYDTPEVEEEPSVEPSAEQPNEIPEIADVANVDRPENETTTQDVQPLTKGSLDNIFNLADGIASQSEETVNESAPVDNSIRNTYTEAPQSSDVGFTATTLGNAVEDVSTGTGIALGEVFQGQLPAAGRSTMDVVKDTVKAPIDLTRTALSGTMGLFQTTGDEVAYLVDAKGYKISAINPKEHVTIAFGCSGE